MLASISKRPDFRWEVRKLYVTITFAPARMAAAKDVAVVGIGQRQGVDQIFVADHKAIANRLVHQRPGSRKPFRGKCGIVLKDIANPLVVNGLGPPRLHQASLRNADEKISQGRRVKNIRVVDRDDGAPPSIAHPGSWASAANSSRILIWPRHPFVCRPSDRRNEHGGTCRRYGKESSLRPAA